jgi:AraC-like DNA-binding protein
MEAVVTQRVVFLGGAGVYYHECPPPPELAPYIGSFWQFRCDRPFTLRVLPDGCTDIIGTDLVGSLSTAITAQLHPGEHTHGIRFRPGGFTALFGVPASELVDLRVPLVDVIRRPKRLIDLARDAPPPDPLAAAAWSTTDIGALASYTGYSARQIHRRVLAATGHSPKRLSRIARMQALLTAGRGASWAQTAARFGFHDEAHMINDIRRLANATPREILAVNDETSRTSELDELGQ